MSHQFTAAQIAHFQTEGYLAVPHFWDGDEIAAMRAEVERFKREGKLRNVATEGDGKTTASQKANLQFCPMSPHSNLFRAMPFAPKVVEAVEGLIGGPLLLQLDQIFLKPAHHGAGTNWHQDNHYFGITRPVAGTALWTAVHDATQDNGALRVIPRAFAAPLPHTRDPDSDHHVRCHPDESRAALLEMEAGGAIFFNYGTPHATGPNRTEKERAGVALHFLTIEANATARSGASPKPLLSGPNTTGGEAEYGERIAGTWPREVEKMLCSPWNQLVVR